MHCPTTTTVAKYRRNEMKYNFENFRNFAKKWKDIKVSLEKTYFQVLFHFIMTRKNILS